MQSGVAGDITLHGATGCGSLIISIAGFNFDFFISLFPLSEKYTELNKILFKKIQMDDGKYGALERKGTMEGVSR